MTTIRKIVTSKIDGSGADSNDINEIRSFGETSFYLDNNNKLTLMMFDGVRTNQRSKVLSPGVIWGSNADSGDGAGLDTIKLIPDARLHYDFGDGNNHQHLIIDPTAPNHIHIRAGGTIDNSNADLFLGGELTHVKVSDGADNVVIRTSISGEGVTPYSWTFSADGTLTFPDLTASLGSKIVVPIDDYYAITTQRYQQVTAITTAGTDPYIGQFELSFDIYSVQAGWEMNTGTEQSPIWTTVTNVGPNPGEYWIYLASGFEFEFAPSTAYTFRNPIQTGSTWQFGEDGTLTFPNDGVIRVDDSNLEIGGMANFNVEATGVVNVYTDNGAHQWQFGDDGALSLPANGVINSSTYSGFSLRSRHDEPIDNLVGSNILISPGQVSINYQVEDQGVPTPGYQWDFNYTTQALDLADGGLKFADNTVQTTAWTGSVSLISSGPTAPGSAVVAGTNDIDFNFSDGVSTAVSITRDSEVVSAKSVGLTLASNFDVKIVTDFTDNNRTWTFNGTDGSITFPDATVQTTAWTGTGTADTGNITFDDNAIQGNPLGTVGTKITVNTNYLGATSQNSNVFNLSKTTDTDQVQIGWIIRGDGGGGQTITNKIDGGSYWQFFVGSGTQTEFPITIESSDYQLGSGAQLVLTVDPGDNSPKSWTLGTDGSLTFPDASVQTTAYVPADNLVKVSDEWEVTAGTNTYSFTVPADGTYIMWVKGNIPNGIITWNATASVSNTNVPTIGTQYAWNYTGGGSPILLTSIPDQIKGVAGTISTDATYAGTTSNRFDFGISNTSGSTQTIYYGYTKIS